MATSQTNLKKSDFDQEIQNTEKSLMSANRSVIAIKRQNCEAAISDLKVALEIQSRLAADQTNEISDEAVLKWTTRLQVQTTKWSPEKPNTMEQTLFNGGNENVTGLSAACQLQMDNTVSHNESRSCARTTIRFCTGSCRDQCWVKWHQFECHQPCDYHELDETDTKSLNAAVTNLLFVPAAQRILTSLGPETLSQVLVSAEEFVSAKLASYGTGRPEIYGDNCKSLLSLMSRQQQLPSKRLKHSSVLSKSFLESEQWPEELQIDMRKQLMELLLGKTCAKIARNASEIEVQVASGAYERVGTGLYMCSSLLNHSCVPNVSAWMSDRATVQWRANRDIQPGEEIVSNYGPEFGTDQLIARQQHLQQLYDFRCSCVACSEPEYAFMEKKLFEYKCTECEKGSCQNRSKQGQLVCEQCGREQSLNGASIQALTERTLMHVRVLIHAQDTTLVQLLRVTLKCLRLQLLKSTEQYLGPQSARLFRIRSQFAEIIVHREKELAVRIMDGLIALKQTHYKDTPCLFWLNSSAIKVYQEASEHMKLSVVVDKYIEQSVNRAGLQGARAFFLRDPSRVIADTVVARLDQLYNDCKKGDI